MKKQTTTLKVRKGTSINHNQSALKVRKGLDTANHNQTVLQLGKNLVEKYNEASFKERWISFLYSKIQLGLSMNHNQSALKVRK
jgi:hypothetical protein